MARHENPAPWPDDPDSAQGAGRNVPAGAVGRTTGVELNPVRAALVDNPEGYPWSSYRARTGSASQCSIDLDPCYLALGWSPTQRAGRYGEYVAERPTDAEYALIRAAVQRGQLTGSRRFVDEVAQMLGRRVEFRGRGRPSNSSRTENNCY